MFKEKILVIQTAFIGDAILATSVLEKLHGTFQDAKIDFLIRKGNESLFKNHPFINTLYVWDKKGDKYKSLLAILNKTRKEKYLYVINLQRFMSTGIFTAFSKAKNKIGFIKNPFSFSFDKKVSHEFGNGKHEVERNNMLIESITDSKYALPKLYPTQENFEAVNRYIKEPFVCISPASVWYTKQFPAEKWLGLIKKLENNYKIYLLGGSDDKNLCEDLKTSTHNPDISNLAGKINLLESAALMQSAEMNYANDSAPLHLATAVNAPITAVFCSTIPGFGFGPLSDKSKVVEISENLSCRPCGLHGRKTCPENHFKCAMDINIDDLLF